MRITAFLICTVAANCLAQRAAIDVYMGRPNILDVANDSSRRSPADLMSILPLRQPVPFAEYVRLRSPAVDLSAFKTDIENLRLNELVGNTAGRSGTTSLVSRVAVPALLGFATEYGGILQSNSGTTTTLRGNAMGIGQMFAGSAAIPDCSEIDQKACAPASRWLRRFSGLISFESATTATTSGTATSPVSTTPLAVDLFGSGFRMASWGLRFDLTTNQPIDQTKWKEQMKSLRGDPSGADLTAAINNLFGTSTGDVSDVYLTWQVETVSILQSAKDAIELRQRLDEQLAILIGRMAQGDPNFAARVGAVRRGFLNYAQIRDRLLRDIQSHQLSVEYTNEHPRSRPSTSNVRLIFSHQPTDAPLLITANAAFTWYNSVPSGANSGRFRDLQIAGQIDRRLGEVANLGNAVATFGGYYQWMKEDALIVIGPGNIAPGSGIVLPGTAAKLLGTKGNIAVLQAKVAFPVSSVVKIPISITWSNRTELINEKDIRGQVGLTLDLDSVFKK